MNNDIKIRVAHREDLPHVYHLVRELAVYEKVVSDPNGTYLSVIGWLLAVS